MAGSNERRKRRGAAWLALCLCLPAAEAAVPGAAAAACLPVLTYHRREPFVEDAARGAGLSFRLVEELNRARPGGHCYALTFATLTEIRERLAAGEAFVMPWASNRWEAAHFKLPSTQPLFFDSNVVVSRREAPLEYAGIESLHGRRIGVVSGLGSVGLDSLVEQGRAIVSMADLGATLDALLAGRIDAVVLSSSALQSLAPRIPLESLHVATAAQDAYGRALLYSPALAAAGPELERFVEGLRSRRDWQVELERRSLDRLFSPADLDLHELTQVPVPGDAGR